MRRDLEALAATVAQRAGELMKNMRANAIRDVDTKTSAVDVVTEADCQTERLIVKLLSTARPNDAFLGEEGGVSGNPDAEITWVIDPIDGTTNYLYGIEASCVSIAATELASGDGVHWLGERESVPRKTVAAAVFNPFTDELFLATAGEGATRNGEAISVRAPESLAQALVATGFGYTEQRRAEQGAVLSKLLPQIRDIRRIGSAAFDLCLLASGRIDAYYERGIQEWDFAAGALIASEAGALIIGRAGELPGSQLLVAAHPTIAQQLRDAVTENSVG